MASPAWHSLKTQAKRAAGFQCQFVSEAGLRCPRTDHLHVHHKHYDTLGQERLEDVQVLCYSHHAIVELQKLRCTQCRRPVLPTAAEAERYWEKYHQLMVRELQELGYFKLRNRARIGAKTRKKLSTFHLFAWSNALKRGRQEMPQVCAHCQLARV